MADVQDFSVEESRAKRAERLQSKYRNRGGVFKPATHNTLLDILLSRGVNGESPSKWRKSRKSVAPPKDIEPQTIERRKSVGTVVQEDEAEDLAPRVPPKGKAKAAASHRKSEAPTRKRVTRREKGATDEDVEDAQTVAWPFRTANSNTRGTRGKEKEIQGGESVEPPKKTTKRAPAKRSTRVIKQAQEMEDEVVNTVPAPKRGSGKRTRRDPDSTLRSSDEEPIVPLKRAKTAPGRLAAKSSRADKLSLETILEESDSEDEPLRLMINRWKTRNVTAATDGVGKSPVGKAPSKAARSGSDWKPKTTPWADTSSFAGRSTAKAIEHDEDHVFAQTTEGSRTLFSTSKQQLPALYLNPYPDGEAGHRTKTTKPTRSRTSHASRSTVKADTSTHDTTFSAEGPHKASSAPTEANKQPDETRGTATSKKRERDRRAAVAQPPADEQEPEDEPASPRKRSKRSTALESDTLADAPAPVQVVVDEVELLQEAEPSVKLKSKSKKVTSARAEMRQRPKTLKENFPATSNSSQHKVAAKYKPKPKPRLSMFPPPVLVVDSDDDPIDFLS